MLTFLEMKCLLSLIGDCSFYDLKSKAFFFFCKTVVWQAIIVRGRSLFSILFHNIPVKYFFYCFQKLVAFFGIFPRIVDRVFGFDHLLTKVTVKPIQVGPIVNYVSTLALPKARPHLRMP